MASFLILRVDVLFTRSEPRVFFEFTSLRVPRVSVVLVIRRESIGWEMERSCKAEVDDPEGERKEREDTKTTHEKKKKRRDEGKKPYLGKEEEEEEGGDGLHDEDDHQDDGCRPRQEHRYEQVDRLCQQGQDTNRRGHDHLYDREEKE